MTDSPLARQTLFIVGRVHGVTRGRLEQLVRARGGKLATRPTGRVTTIAFGHSAVAGVLSDGRLRLPTGLPASAAMISEHELRRRLGILAPPSTVERGMSDADIERLAGLTPRQRAC